MSPPGPAHQSLPTSPSAAAEEHAAQLLQPTIHPMPAHPLELLRKLVEHIQVRWAFLNVCTCTACLALCAFGDP